MPQVHHHQPESFIWLGDLLTVPGWLLVGFCCAEPNDGGVYGPGSEERMRMHALPKPRQQRPHAHMHPCRPASVSNQRATAHTLFCKLLERRECMHAWEACPAILHFLQRIYLDAFCAA